MEHDILRSFLEQKVLKVEQTFTFDLHLALEALEQFHVFLALHEKRKVAISFQILQMI